MSATMANTPEHDDVMPGERSGGEDVDEEEPTQQYHIEFLNPLPETASCQALQAENAMLCDNHCASWYCLGTGLHTDEVDGTREQEAEKTCI